MWAAWTSLSLTGLRASASQDVHSTASRSSRNNTNRMESTVTKSELVQSIADSALLSKQEAERALTAVVSAITTGVASGDKVVLPGLGTFERRDRAAREGRNPRSGETIQIAASTVPGFKPAAAFKAAVAAK